PTHSLTLVIPFAAGGGIDASARIQAQHMGELLGQTMVVENIGAAAGMAGSLSVAKAAPDGYRFLIGNTGTHAFNQTLYKKPLYNAAEDFQPVGLMTESPRIPIVRKLNKTMSDTIDDPAIRKRLEDLGLEILPMEQRSPEYLAKFLPQEIERWGRVIRSAGISID